jgi:hypothetical protein
MASGLGGALVLVVGMAAPPAAAPAPDAAKVRIDGPARARFGRGEVAIDAVDRPGPPPSKLRVHGEARVSLGFGAVLEDPTAAVTPSVAIDLRELAPVRFAFAVPLRLRMVDRAPDDRGVLRLQDWNEVGDYFALLSDFHYGDAHAFGDTGRVTVRIDAGRQRDVVLGHGSLVRGWANSLDIDRRRTGVAIGTSVGARLLDQPAELALDLLLGDVAGSQVLASRLGARWAGAGLGGSVAGDPTAPHALATTGGMPDSFVIGRGGALRSVGPRGVVAAAVDLEYRATDHWRWSVGPYVDLAMLANLGKGAHVGADGDVLLGRRRGLMLGATAELTVGSAGWDPAYFDVFYGAQRWHTPPLGRPKDADDASTTAAPKYAFVRDEVPKGVGGMGALRMSHRSGGMARMEYRMRPGPFGHTFSLIVGVDLPEVGLFARFAHRGDRHGFEPKLQGTLAQLELDVPVIRYLHIEVAAGWTFAIRPDTRTGADADAGFVAGGGLVLAGIAGRIPW